jgi:hypothetical protein
MTGTIITEERNIANALISGLANLTETPTREQVEEKAKQIAAIFGYTGDLRNIITEAMISVDTRMGAGVSLVDVAAKHDDQWVRKREDITWTYGNAYENFLLKDGWPPRMVQSLSDVTSRILGHLQDPHSEGTTWNRRGLVIGHVQSGKTANYTGVIARGCRRRLQVHHRYRRHSQQSAQADPSSASTRDSSGGPATRRTVAEHRCRAGSGAILNPVDAHEH